MATYRDIWVDSSAGGAGSGSQADPCKTLAQAEQVMDRTAGNVNRVHLRCGSVFNERVPHNLSHTPRVGLYLDSYGDGPAPVIDVSRECTDEFSYDESMDWYVATLGTHDWGDKPDKLTIGAIFEDGQPLPFQMYTADPVLLRQRLASGGYSYNWDNGQVFMVPSLAVEGLDRPTPGATSTIEHEWIPDKPGKPRPERTRKPDDTSKPDKPPKPDKPGKPPAPEPAPEPPPVEPPIEPPVEPPVEPPTPTPHTYRVAVQSLVMSCNAPGPFEDEAPLNWHFKGIHFVGAKRHAVECGTSKVLFEQCRFFGHGGQRFGESSENYLGNGIEIAQHANDVTVRDCEFEQIFDSGATTQTYGNAEYVTNVLFEGNTFSKCGLSCIEVSVQVGNAETRTQYVKVLDNTLKSNRGCFAPDIYGGRYAGVTIIYNVTDGILDDIEVRGNTIEDMQHCGMTITECGQNILVEDNDINRCETGIFYGPGEGNLTTVDIKANRLKDNKTGLRVNGSANSAQAFVEGNTIEGGDTAFSDGSSGQPQVELINNILNSATAVAAERTDGITGHGNTSTGTIDPTYGYLFEAEAPAPGPSPSPTPIPPDPSLRYVRPAASGDGKGLDWANAMAWPSSFTRGLTYYLASGSYAGRTFNTAASGETPVTIKKATADDHGSGTGWNDSYGDGQAVFNGGFKFLSSYWVIDGQTGGGVNQWKDGFGFKVIEKGDSTPVLGMGDNNSSGAANHVTIRHVDLIGKGSVSTQGGGYSNDGLAIYGADGITLSYFHMAGIGRCPFFISPRNLVVEHGCIESFYGSGDVHSEVASIWAFSGTVGDVTFRYNLILDVQSTGGIMWDNSSNNNATCRIYGNVFYQAAGKTWSDANGCIGGWTGGGGEDCYNLLVYNNTFVDVKPEIFTDFIQRSGNNVANNNLFYRCNSPSYSDFTTHDYNHYIDSGGTYGETHASSASGDPFVNATGLDFHLKAATPAGQDVAAPMDSDPHGNKRGADGTWDRGAFEFVG